MQHDTRLRYRTSQDFGRRAWDSNRIILLLKWITTVLYTVLVIYTLPGTWYVPAVSTARTVDEMLAFPELESCTL